MEASCNGENLYVEQKQLIRATVNKMEYSVMKDQLKNVIYCPKYE